MPLREPKQSIQRGPLKSGAEWEGRRWRLKMDQALPCTVKSQPYLMVQMVLYDVRFLM